MVVNIIIKPTQSGKTFEIINMIQKQTNSNIISIVLVDNKLLETVQFKNRIDDKLPDSFILSSTSKICNNKDTALVLLLDTKKIMICCKNKVRINNIEYILNFVCKNKPNVTFCIYIDEADTQINTLSNIIHNWSKLHNVNKITLATATPDKVKRFFPNIKSVNTRNINHNMYVSLQNCKFNIIEYNHEHTIHGYVTNVFDDIYDKIIKNPNFLIPGGRTKKTHSKMKKKLLDIGYSVLIINGNGWILYHNNIQINDDNYTISPSKRLSNLYKKYKLRKVPFAITGQICIGRAVTFVSDSFQFTHAIFAPYYDNNSDNAYQLAGRLTGNYKKYMIYTPQIYCSQKFKKTVLKAEKNVMH